jgi:hypothetical protein
MKTSRIRRGTAIGAAAALALAASAYDAPALDQARPRIAGRPDVTEMGPIYYAASELAPGYATVIPARA